MSEKRISRKELKQRNKKQNTKRKNLRNLMIIAVTALLLYMTGLYGASLAYFGDFVSSGTAVFQLGAGFPVEDDFSSVTQAGDMGTTLALLDPDNFTVYSPTARKIFTYSHSMQNPVMDVASKRAVLYDIGGTELKVANGHSVLFGLETENAIIHADISDSNRVAITTRSSSYNGEVAVYNYNMKQRFVWYCATAFPVYSLLSDSGKVMAVNTVSTQDGLLVSSIFVIDAAAGTEMYTIDLYDYPLYMEFLSDTRLVIGFSDRLVLWDVENNTQLASLDFGSNVLQAVHCTNRYIAVAWGGQRRDRTSRLTLLTKDFEEKFTVNVGEKIKDLSISSSRLYALAGENIYEYDYSATHLNTVNTGALSKQLVDYNGTLLLTSTSISKVEKTKSR